MNLRRLYLTQNNCFKAGKKISVKGVMLHSTGANNSQLKRYVGPDDGQLGKNQYNNHWNRAKPDGYNKCPHAFIGKLNNGKIATYQTLPWNYRGWHAGGTANNTHIGFEICEDSLQDAAYFTSIYKESAELTAYLCDAYKLNPLEPGVVICHQEGYKRSIATNHSDVLHWFPKFGKSMDTFRKDVADLLAVNLSPLDPTPKPTDVPYLVKIEINNLNIRTGPGTSFPSVGCTGTGVFTIIDEARGQGASKWGQLKSGAGWISLDYAKGLSTVAQSTIKVGNIVTFKGGYHYASSTDTKGHTVENGRAKVTKIVSGAKHPYHLVGIDCSVYGWVDKNSIYK